jgi:hypothetical protein
MSKPSKADWKRLEKLKDDQIDTSDIPALGEDFFVRAQLRPTAGPRKQGRSPPAPPPH